MLTRLLQFQIFRVWLVVCLVIGLYACGSPEERALEFSRAGMELLEQGDLDRASIEFRNALQLQDKLVEPWYGLSLIAERKGDWKKVFSLLNEVLARDPNRTDARVRLGRLLLAAGQLDKALESSNQAIEQAPVDPDVLSLRAAIFYKLDDNEAAVKFATKALDVAPDHIDALAVLATERMAAGKPEEALVFIEQGLSKTDQNVALQLMKIDALTQIGRAGEVEQMYRQLIDIYPNAQNIKQRLVRFYLLNNREPDAEQLFRDMADANPEDVQAKLTVVRFINATKGVDAALAELDNQIEQQPGNTELKFFRVQFLFSADQAEAAEELLQVIIDGAYAPEAKVQAMGLLAAAKYRSGQQDDAKKLVEKVLAQDPRNEQALVLRVNSLIAERKLDEAISDARKVLRDSPKSARALVLLAKAHELSGSPDLAEDTYSRAYEASNRSAVYALEYARYLLMLQRLNRAKEVLVDALAVDRSNLLMLSMLARIHTGLGEWSEAQSVADRIKLIDGEDGISEQIQGVVFAGQKKFEESIEAFKLAQQAAPDATEPVVSLVRTYARAGKFKEAEAFLDSVVAASPGNNNARLLKGQLAAAQRNYKGAASLFEDVITRDPKNRAAYQSLSTLNARLGKLDDALAVLERGLKQLPEDMTLTLSKAEVLEGQQKFDAAIAVYEKILSVQPNADVVANNLASLLSDHRNDKASLQQAHELALRFRNSKIAYFKDTLGWTYFRIGNPESALDYIREAVELLPNLPVIRYHLGMTHMELNNKEAARQEFGKALELAGDKPFPFRGQIEEAIKSL